MTNYERSRTFYVEKLGFTVDWEHMLLPQLGVVGNLASMDCHDASSFDVAHVISESQIAFGFEPPTAITDEFWSSHGFVGQTSQLMMNVLHPDVPAPSLATMSHIFEETDGDDLSFDKEILTRQKHFFAHFVSSGQVPAGQSVVVTVGARTFDKGRADDMEVVSRSECHWFLNSIEVRVRP